MTMPLILPPGGGPSVQIGTKTTTFKITGEQTNGQFGLFEHAMPPHATGASSHLHRRTIEMFYVVAGEVDIEVADRTVNATPGTFVFVPTLTPHAFSNRGSLPAVMLIMFCPGGSREEYFLRLAELRSDGRTPSQEELIALMERFDQYPLD